MTKAVNRKSASNQCMGMFAWAMLLILSSGPSAPGKAQDYLPPDPSYRPLLRKVTLFASGGIPLGEFGDNDPLAVNAGYAYPGAGAGVEYSPELVRGFGLSFCGMINIHGHDASQWKKLIPYFSYDGTDRILLWALAGPMLNLDLSPAVNLYVAGQIGPLYVNYPDLTVKDTYGEQLAIESKAVLTAGYRIGLGTAVNRLDVGIHYLYADPEFTPTYKLIFGRVSGDFLPEKKPVRILELTLGYIVH